MDGLQSSDRKCRIERIGEREDDIHGGRRQGDRVSMRKAAENASCGAERSKTNQSAKVNFGIDHSSRFSSKNS